MTRLRAWRGWHRGLLVAIGGLIAVLALGAGSHSADAQVAQRIEVHSPAVVLTAAETPSSTASQSSATATTTPSGTPARRRALRVGAHRASRSARVAPPHQAARCPAAAAR
jgi:hypothetical protein